MSEQLEFDFGRRYDIFSDQLRPVGPWDLATYQDISWAYGKIREAACRFQGAVPVVELDRIHSDLKQRIAVR